MTTPGSFNTLHINLNRKPFDNIRVRQALMYAIDRHAVAEALKPMGGFMAGLQPDFFPAGFKTEDLPPELQYNYDPEKAKALLAEAGFPDGFDFDSNCSQREDYSSTMLIVQEQLRAVGFRMNLKIGDHTAYHADNRSDKNTLAMHSSSYPPIPTQLYFQQLSSKHPRSRPTARAAAITAIMAPPSPASTICSTRRCRRPISTPMSNSASRSNCRCCGTCR